MKANLNEPTQSKTIRSSKPTKVRKSQSKTKPTRKLRQNASTKKRPNKRRLIEQALSSLRGASIAELMKITGWQDHSVRAALSGLRKQGYPIERHQAKDAKGKPTVYWIAGDQIRDPGQNNKSGYSSSNKHDTKRNAKSNQNSNPNRKGAQS